MNYASIQMRKVARNKSLAVIVFVIAMISFTLNASDRRVANIIPTSDDVATAGDRFAEMWEIDAVFRLRPRPFDQPGISPAVPGGSSFLGRDVGSRSNFALSGAEIWRGFGTGSAVAMTHPTSSQINRRNLRGDQRMAMKKYSGKRRLHILVIEDARQIRQALWHSNEKFLLHIVADAFEVMANLRRERPHMRAPSADLVLFDGGLGEKSTDEFFAELKTNPELAEIPVTILEDSESERSLIEDRSYAVDGAIRKPISIAELVQTLMSIDRLPIQFLRSELA